MTGPDGSAVHVSTRALFVFEGGVKEAIVALKYDRQRRLAGELSRHLVGALTSEAGVDVVTWAPTTRIRRRERGFDHSELIARHCAADSGIVHRGLLRRLNRENQTGSPRQVRQFRPRFVARPLRGSPHVCVIDDVVTTGATIRAAARALCQAGAGRVLCLAIAHVPDSMSRAPTPPGAWHG